MLAKEPVLSINLFDVYLMFIFMIIKPGKGIISKLAKEAVLSINLFNVYLMFT